MFLLYTLGIVTQAVSLDWTQIIVQLIATVGVLLTILLPIMHSTNKKVESVHQNSLVIRNETRNSHAPDRPMRHDIDVLLERTKDLPAMRKDIGGLRSDVRQLYKNDSDIWDTLATRWSRRGTGSLNTEKDIKE